MKNKSDLGIGNYIGIWLCMVAGILMGTASFMELGLNFEIALVLVSVIIATLFVALLYYKLEKEVK